MKKLPIGIQTFSKIIEGDYAYADKTQHIYNLINNASYYFLSRPRRFGKSLLLDTIGEVFKGNKELFRGLWIYGSDYSFEKYPVIRLDMSNIPNETPDILKNSLMRELNHLAKKEDVEIIGDEPADLFKRLIECLHAKYGKKTVVLIDEYDKPIIDHLFEIPAAEANRMVVKGFYGVLKSMDPHLKFTFLTGVSKFVKTSVFSELNNLTDITMVEKYTNICGISADELDTLFGEHIESLRPLRAFQNCNNIHDEIIRWYDGYSWDGINRVINPFSLLSLFVQKKFGAFWYASGNPKFLIDLIKKNPNEFLNLKTLEMTEQTLDAADFNKLEAKPLLFQTGYLTVKDVVYNGVAPSYMLEAPNLEVREAFHKNIIAAFTESGHSEADNFHFGMGKALRAGDLPKALDALRSLFASIPYNLHVEASSENPWERGRLARIFLKNAGMMPALPA
ncbi:MAG: AAA family ATPase, partial [Oscillospiraceae bacterium]|nr:AAA family ATPase [Oscillospiraceae bacterium]